MTPTTYYIALIAKSFGLERRNKRLADASSEMGLLREAEYQLGKLLWEKIEIIEELSVEYWNLRKYVKEHHAYTDSMNELNERLSALHTKRADILNEDSTQQDEITQRREELLLKLEELAYKRDSLVRRAKDIRRIHEGHLTKIEVLEREGHHADEVEEVKSDIEALKEEFRLLKQERAEIAEELENGDKKLDEIDGELMKIKQEKRDRAAIVFQEIGGINRQLSDIRSDIGNCETQIRHLQASVGRYISRYYKRHRLCGEVAKHQRAMVEVMRMLRISIAMNHKLSDFK